MKKHGLDDAALSNTQLPNYSITTFLSSKHLSHRWLSAAEGFGGNVSGVFRHCGLKNAAIVTQPMAISVNAKTRQARPNHRRERSLTVMPHLAQKRYKP